MWRWSGPIALAAVFGGMGACSDSDPAAGSRDAASRDVAAPDGGRVDAGREDAGVDDAGPDFGPSECDPLIPSVCALPWPSNRYLTAGEGPDFELQFIPGALPVDAADVPFEVLRLQVHDGYSVDTPIVVSFPNVDPSGLPDATSLEASLAEDAPILLFRREGIELVRIPYWVEMDTAEPDPAARLMFVRPAERLLPGTSYYVAFRDLVTTDGSPVPRSQAFQRLVDRDTEGTELEPRQSRFDDVISALIDEGVERESMVLAWDFRTARRERVQFRLGAMRRAYDQIRAEQGKLPFTVTSTVIHEGDPERFVSFGGVMQVPWFLRPADINGVMGEVLNEAGGDPTPIPVGLREVPFRIEIPPTASDDVRDPPRSIVVQVGHPYLSDASMIESERMTALATERRLILVATDWPGIDGLTGPELMNATRDLNRLQFVIDRIHQGFVNQWALADAMQDYFSRDYVLSVLNTIPGEVHYLGFEAAAGLGPALLASTPVLERGALVTPAIDVVSVAGRSRLGSSLLEGMGDDLVDVYGSRAEGWIGVLTTQMLFDYVASSLYVGSLHGAPAAPFAPARALFTAAVGDRHTPTVDLEALTRTSTYGVALLEDRPEGRPVPRVEPTPYPHSGTGAVWFDVGAPYPPPGMVVPEGEGADPHDLVLDRPAHWTMVRSFLESGTIRRPPN